MSSWELSTGSVDVHRASQMPHHGSAWVSTEGRGCPPLRRGSHDGIHNSAAYQVTRDAVRDTTDRRGGGFP
jgi:hypothetical protein